MNYIHSRLTCKTDEALRFLLTKFHYTNDNEWFYTYESENILRLCY